MANFLNILKSVYSKIHFTLKEESEGKINFLRSTLIFNLIIIENQLIPTFLFQTVYSVLEITNLQLMISIELQLQIELNTIKAISKKIYSKLSKNQLKLAHLFKSYCHTIYLNTLRTFCHVIILG